MADYAAEDAAYDAAVKAEWGLWVANGRIYLDGALAFTDGASVPSSTVARFDLEAGQYVRKVGDPPPAAVSAVAPAPLGDPILIPADAAPVEADLTIPDAPEPDPEPPVDEK